MSKLIHGRYDGPLDPVYGLPISPGLRMLTIGYIEVRSCAAHLDPATNQPRRTLDGRLRLSDRMLGRLVKDQLARNGHALYFERNGDLDAKAVEVNFDPEAGKRRWIDMRMTGAVATFQGKAGEEGRITGAIRYEDGISLDPVSVVPDALVCTAGRVNDEKNQALKERRAKKAVEGEDLSHLDNRKTGNMGTTYIAEFSLNECFEHYDPVIGARNGVTEADLSAHTQAYIQCTDGQRSSIRKDVSLREVYKFVWDPQVDRRITVAGLKRYALSRERITKGMGVYGVFTPTCFEDYRITLRPEMIPDSVAVFHWSVESDLRAAAAK